MANKKGFQKISFDLKNEINISVYAGVKVTLALNEVKEKLDTLYHGVRLAEVLEAFYVQGLKNGRREMIEKMDALKSGVKYLPPGQPKKKQKTSN
jgi:hypothetical protein